MSRYDWIGQGYARRRRPDPRLAAAIEAALGDARTVINVGAGSGSYEPADRETVAVEPSGQMVAQRHPTAAPVVRATAEALPFQDASFDAAMAILTVHHWNNRSQGLAELCRVAPRRVIVTFDPVIHNEFWLIQEYIPAAAVVESNRASTLEEIARAVTATRVEVLPVPHDCVDGFGWAYWRRPWTYLDAEARGAISMLAQLRPSDLEPGLAQLENDLTSGVWHERHVDLLDLDSIDGGFRLIIGEDP